MNQDPSRRDSPGEDEAVDEISAEQDDAVIGIALRRSAVALAALAMVALAVLWFRSRAGDAGPEIGIAAAAPEQVAAISVATGPPVVEWVEVGAERGVDFDHVNGSSAGERFLPETMGSGAAFFDFDRDGDQDLLISNSQEWGGGDSPSALYVNDGTGRFEDRAAELGLDLQLYGTAVTVGDIDNDGFQDVFVSAVGVNRLLRNVDDGRGGRVFVDQTEASGVAGDPAEWSSSSTFFDMDRDGDLDLFVGNYVRWSREIDLELNYTLTGDQRAYGPPVNYQGTFPYLYRNDGVGPGGAVRFVDVSGSSGVQVVNPATGVPVAKSLGVAPIDLDRDGWIDLVVANDTVRNFVLRNLGDGTFEEVGELFGLAYGRDGNATGAMGIDAGHPLEEDDLGIAIGNFANEMSSLYLAQGDPSLYADEAIGTGVGAPSRRVLSFGVFFFDYDLDGRLDLLQTNGHLENEINTVDPSQQYRQPAQLFWNAGSTGSRLYVDVEESGALAEPIVGRASAFADIDADGDLDVVVLQAGDRAMLFENQQQTGHHWLRVTVRGNGRTVPVDGYGAWLELEAEGRLLRRQVVASRSYQSQSESTVTFGLGKSDTAPRLKVTWPDGSEQSVSVERVDTTVEIVQGA